MKRNKNTKQEIWNKRVKRFRQSLVNSIGNASQTNNERKYKGLPLIRKRDR